MEHGPLAVCKFHSGDRLTIPDERREIDFSFLYQYNG